MKLITRLKEDRTAADAAAAKVTFTIEKLADDSDAFCSTDDALEDDDELII